MRVEVAYALPDKQKLIELDVPEGTSMFDAVVQSNIVEEFPELNIEAVSMGIFSKVEASPRTRILQENERVEIYRPLIIDPKEARKNRAAKVAAQKKVPN